MPKAFKRPKAYVLMGNDQARLRKSIRLRIRTQGDLDLMLARLPANMRELALERARPHLGFEPAKIVSEVLITDTYRGPAIVRVPDPFPPPYDPNGPLLIPMVEMTREEFRERYPDHPANSNLEHQA